MTREQADNFRRFVRPHLDYLSGDQTVNPREVKRLLNAYTLQLKMLRNRTLPPDGLRPDVVVGLQTIDFRADWQRLYDELAADPDLFVNDVRSATTGQAWTSSGEPLPQAFLNYVNGVGKRMLETPLRPYLSAAEAGRSTQPGLLVAQAAVGYLLRRADELKAVGTIGSEDLSEFLARLETVSGELRKTPTSGAPSQALTAVDNVRNEITLLPNQPQASQVLRLESVRLQLQVVLESLRELRRQTNVGAVAS